MQYTGADCDAPDVSYAIGCTGPSSRGSPRRERLSHERDIQWNPDLYTDDAVIRVRDGNFSTPAPAQSPPSTHMSHSSSDNSSAPPHGHNVGVPAPRRETR